MTARAAATLAILAAATAAPSARAQSIRFTERAAAVGLTGSFLQSPGYPPDLALMIGPVSVGDFNRDGLPDLFAPSGGDTPDRLFINLGGRFEDQAASWGVDAQHRGSSAAIGDVNGDGYDDIFLISFGHFLDDPNSNACKLYINSGPDDNGNFHFTDTAEQAGVKSISRIIDGMGACFGDYDLDGDLDLFVSAWHGKDGSNRLFANDGSGIFTDVTDAALGDTTAMRSFTPRFADINADGWPDLLLTNDFNTSRLYLSNGPDPADGAFTFTNTAVASGITLDCNGMGSTLADFDGDGLLDWFMTNIYFPEADTCGNTLYRNLGNTPDGVPIFEQIARAQGVLSVGWGWGTSALDIDNDADLDIAATAGWGAFNQGDLTTALWINDGTGSFTDVADNANFQIEGLGRALVHLDYDLDGDLDIVIAPSWGPLMLFHNESNPAIGGWLRLSLDTSQHPCLASGGLGARIVATIEGRDHLRLVDGSYTYQGQSEQTIHFGLGGASTIDRVEITWPDGSSTTLTDVAKNQTLTITPRHPADLNPDGRLDFFDVAAFLHAYAAGSPEADLNADGTVDVADVAALIDAILNPCP